MATQSMHYQVLANLTRFLERAVCTGGFERNSFSIIDNGQTLEIDQPLLKYCQQTQQWQQLQQLIEQAGISVSAYDEQENPLGDWNILEGME